MCRWHINHGPTHHTTISRLSTTVGRRAFDLFGQQSTAVMCLACSSARAGRVADTLAGEQGGRDPLDVARDLILDQFWAPPLGSAPRFGPLVLSPLAGQATWHQHPLAAMAALLATRKTPTVIPLMHPTAGPVQGRFRKKAPTPGRVGTVRGWLVPISYTDDGYTQGLTFLVGPNGGAVDLRRLQVHHVGGGLTMSVNEQASGVMERIERELDANCGEAMTAGAVSDWEGVAALAVLALARA